MIETSTGSIDWWPQAMTGQACPQCGGPTQERHLEAGDTFWIICLKRAAHPWTCCRCGKSLLNPSDGHACEIVIKEGVK